MVLVAALCWGLALAGPAEVHRLEWRRAKPLELVAELPEADASGRSRVAVALGRTRDPAAVDPVAGLLDDVSPEVRLAAAHALGWIPGSADALRSAIEHTPASETHLRAALLGSLGRQGSTRDLALLQEALREPWPIGAAAGIALGRMARREVPALQGAVPVLVSRLDAFDSRMVEAAAFALKALKPTLTPDDVEELLHVARTSRSPSARAWLIGAAWTSLSREQRDTLFVEGMTGTSRLVRVALLDAQGPDDMPGDVLQAWLVDPDPWVRSAALHALGRVGGTRDLRRVAEDTSRPFVAAAAVDAIAEADAEIALDETVPVPVRAAHAVHLTEVEPLGALLVSEEPVLRSAAALAVIQLESLPRELGEALWTSEDPLVREVATMPVGEAGDVRRLLVAAGEEEHPEVLASMAEALRARASRDPRAVRASDARVRSLLERLAAVPTLRARHQSEGLAEALSLPLPEQVDPALAELSWPLLDEVHGIQEARVHTDHGDFVISLDADTAPVAVHAFATLAEQGFYDGLRMHRMVPGFVVQGGDPRGDGWGGPGFGLPDEVSWLPFDEGAVGMARGGPDTGGSQWFVTTAPAPHLVGDYTRFGTVVQGLHRAQRLPAGTVILDVEIVREGPPRAEETTDADG